MRLLPVGDAAFLVEVGDPGEVHPVAASLRAAAWAGCHEIVPGAATVLAVFADAQSCRDALAEAAPVLRGASRGADRSFRDAAAGGAAAVVLAVLYDGPDLEAVADHCGVTPSELVARHSAATYEASFLGFSPGFAYLSGGDPSIDVARLEVPRTRVPAGSVAVAGGMTAVYPQDTPGGWRIIGRTDAAMFDPDRDPPALLAPGRRVRFEAADEIGRAATIRPSQLPPPGSRHLLVVDPGPLSTVQDLGRSGFGHLGVPAAGSLDRRSASAANALVGNQERAAVIEATLAGPRLVTGSAMVVAVTGAATEMTVDGLPAATGAALRVGPGTEIWLHPYRSGARAYVAVDGGIDVPPVLASRSSDTLSGLGPRPLRSGDRVSVGTTAPHGQRGSPAMAGQVVRRPPAGASGAALVVGARIGPRDDRLAAAGIDRLAAGTFEVQGDSDRTGLRLSGPHLPLRDRRELPSEGMVAGAVQVPPSGRPVVLLRNHPTTGGYPVVAVVDDDGVDALAQAVPGDLVSFRLR